MTLENITAAESQIRDTDFAAETATLTRQQILAQAASTVLTNANARPQSVPPPPVFSTSPDASGDGEPNLLGSSRSSVAVAVGGRALDAPAAAVGKVGLVVL